MKPSVFLSLLLTSVAFLLPCPRVPAQSYDAALGLRLGTDWGATAQLRVPQVHKNFVLEGILQSSFGSEEGLFTLLGKQHQPLLSRRVNLFYGAGLHTGWNNEVEEDTGDSRGTPLGITGIVGAEITFKRINLSYDFKPVVNVRGGSRALQLQQGISLRYVVAKRNDIWDKKKERQRRKRRRDRERERTGKRWWQVWK